MSACQEMNMSTSSPHPRACTLRVHPPCSKGDNAGKERTRRFCGDRSLVLVQAVGETWDKFPELKFLALKRMYKYMVRFTSSVPNNTCFISCSPREHQAVTISVPLRMMMRLREQGKAASIRDNRSGNPGEGAGGAADKGQAGAGRRQQRQRAL